jgi:hypothetical protein
MHALVLAFLAAVSLFIAACDCGGSGDPPPIMPKSAGFTYDGVAADD